MSRRILLGAFVIAGGVVASLVLWQWKTEPGFAGGMTRGPSEQRAVPTLQGTPSAVAPVAPVESVASAVPAAEAAPGVQGTVTLWDGRPGAALEVFLVPADEPVPPRRKGRQWENRTAVPAERAARTDESGRYALASVPQEGEWVVVIRVSEPYEVRSPPLRSADGAQRRDFDVPAPAVLRVRLTNPRGDGLLIRQADVVTEYVWYSLPDEEVPELWEIVANVAPGRLHLDLWPEAGPTVQSDVDLAPGEQRELVVTVPDDGEVRGRIVDPLRRERVDASLIWSGDRVVHGEAGADGTFRLTGTGRGRGKLTAWIVFMGAGHTSVEMDDLEPDGSDVELVLRATPRLVARVAGLPADARLTVGLLSAGQTSVRRGPLSDFAAGQLDVAPAAGEPTLLVLWSDRMAPTIVDVPALAPGEERDLGTLVMGNGRDVEGSVHAADGSPVAGAELRVAERWSDAQTTADAEGRFLLPRLPVRAFLLRIRALGFPQHLVTVPGSVRGKVDVVLTRGGTLTGEVAGPDGRPATGSWVTVFPPDENPYDRDHDKTRVSATAGADGRFSLPLSAGRHRIRADGADGLRSETQEIEVGEGQTSEVQFVIRMSSSAAR